MLWLVSKHMPTNNAFIHNFQVPKPTAWDLLLMEIVSFSLIGWQGSWCLSKIKLCFDCSANICLMRMSFILQKKLGCLPFYEIVVFFYFWVNIGMFHKFFPTHFCFFGCLDHVTLAFNDYKHTTAHKVPSTKTTIFNQTFVGQNASFS